MKKLYAILPLLALLPLLFSCGETELGETVFDDPLYMDHACRLTPSEGGTKAPAVLQEATLAGNIASIELTESGLYVIGRLTSGTDNTAYSYGHYTVSDDLYTLQGFGTLRFENTRSDAVGLTITPQNSTPQTVEATLTKAASNNPAYRTWHVEKTRLTVKGWTTASVDFSGCNFKEIADFLKRNGNKIPNDVPNRSISSITLTGTESMILIYNDGTVDMNEFSLAGNTLSYNWNDGSLGFTFQSERAEIEYMDGRCILTMEVRILNSTTSGSISFVLTPMN